MPTSPATTPAPKTTPPSAIRRPWEAIHNFTYWLDNPNLQQIGASPFELAVIDYSADGSAAGAFTEAQIAALRKGGCDRRVVAYLSIGQAENYRWYWQPTWHPGTPSWLGQQDPDWAGNYWVNYWDPAWQQIIFSYVDKIVAAGFDGIYLDRVDAYQESYAAGHERDMVQFVERIASYARAHSPLGNDFGVIVQNAEDLATYPDYVSTVTGIGREEVYVRATDEVTSTQEQASAEKLLDVFRRGSQGHLVLTIDYATKASLIRTAYERALAHGYIPYVTDVDLNRMRTNPDFEPVCHPLA